MLFNSYAFLFAFLPVALIGYQVAGFFHRRFVIAWLGLMSLVFYAYWRPALLPLLIFSVILNYLAGSLISRQIPNRISSRIWLGVAISIDLSVLCYFKYLFPSLNFLSTAVGSSLHWADVVLPLGISFFTFTQIAFLVDLHQGIASQQDFGSYMLFVTFFPHLIAGPILHHKDMMPQFQQDRRYRLDPSDLAIGVSWFIMGLGKKVLLADNFALIANPIFSTRETLLPEAAWIGALSYGLQLYFDFSGYSDMALGLARMFSINFPLNFNSPLKARSIIEFWQCWHMTLSQYIMSYLYTPVQLWVRAQRLKAGRSVMRKDMTKPGAFVSLVAFPMMLTLFVAGVWHGAGFQFIAYGLLHGFFLTVNHGWRLLTHKRVRAQQSARISSTIKAASSLLLTFFCVLISFIFFRSRNISHASSIVLAMAGARRSASFVMEGSLAHKSLEIMLGLGIVWFLPNTQEILSRFKPSLDESAWDTEKVLRCLLWSPSSGWALVLGALFFVILAGMENPSTFLYFQF